MSRLISLLALLGGMLLFQAAPALAATTVQGGNLSLPSDQTVVGNYYAQADQLTIDGTVQGDVVAFAQSITVHGHITGSLLAAANDISIDGQVDQNVRTLSGTLSVKGKVGRDVTALAGTLDLAKGAAVGDSLLYAASQPSLQGTVGGMTRSLSLPAPQPPTPADVFYDVVRSFLALGLLGVLVHSFQSYGYTERLAESLRSHPLRSFLFGLLAVLFLPLLVLLLCLSGVGLWVGLSLAFLLGLAFLLAAVDAAYFLGRLVTVRSQPRPNYLTALFLVGSFLLIALSRMSFLAIIPALLWCAALGLRLEETVTFLRNERHGRR